MPKITPNPKTRAQIQADSDTRRGVKCATYKLPIEFIEELAALSKNTGLSRSAIIIQAVRAWRADNKQALQ